MQTIDCSASNIALSSCRKGNTWGKRDMRWCFNNSFIFSVRKGLDFVQARLITFFTFSPQIVLFLIIFSAPAKNSEGQLVQKSEGG